MLGAHGIISFSPELGTELSSSEQFYPDPETIPTIIDYEYPVIETFFRRNMPLIKLHSSGFL